MSSYRPDSSVPPWTSAPATEVPEKPQPITGPKPYIPNVFDLVVPSHRAYATPKLYIPPVFLQSEAVDSSLLIGHGASFTVTRQILPPGPAEIVERKDMGGWTVESRKKAPKRPGYVIYKSARVSFQPNGEPASPRDLRALQSILTEFHSLVHPPLLEHPNIIDFLGVAWASDHMQPLHRLPVLVVEYGDQGTLTDVQVRGSPLPNALKLSVSQGIARGLKVLHDNGIVHGDLKPENIIMCSDPEKILVPKLADFGFAVMESTDAPEVKIGGTRTWRAPESFYPVPTHKLKLTDVFSLGLVVWSIAIDGKSPFSLVLPKHLRGEELSSEIDRLKAEDEVLFLSKFENWLMAWCLTTRFSMASTTIQASSLFRQSAATLAALSDLDPCLVQQALEMLLDREKGSEKPSLIEASASIIYEFLRQETFFKDLESLFARTLPTDPDSRSLEAVIRLLDGKQETNNTE